MQFAHQFGRLDIDGVFILELPLHTAEHEGEDLYFLRKFLQSNFPLVPCLKVVEFKSLEIAQQNIARQVAIIFDTGEVFERLLFCCR